MSELITLREAASLSGYSINALKMRIRRGKLTAVRGNDGLLRVRRDDVAGLPPPSVPIEEAPDMRRQDTTQDTTLSQIFNMLQVELKSSRVDLLSAREAAARESALRQAAEARAESLYLELQEARKPFFIKLFSGLKKNHP